MPDQPRKTFVMNVPNNINISEVIRMFESHYATVEYPSKDSEHPTRTLFIHILERDLH